ncbi:hypothetical protein K501DRAFT_276371 [Backusella circina FSU 941]|nr:hypothetical protein K501DRAFT_276371 [Backusella circina FSU 941]
MTKLVLDNVKVTSVSVYLNFQGYLTKKYPTIHHMNKLDPFLRSFTCANNDLFKIIFPMLDKCNCHLKVIASPVVMYESDIKTFVISKQVKSRQRRSLYWSYNTILLSHLPKFTALSELHLVYYYKSNSNVTVDFDINHILPAIRNTIHIDLFICQAFPELRTLTMDQCTWMVSAFHLANLKLSYLEFRNSLPPEKRYVLVETLCSKEKRWYTADKVSKSNPNPTGDSCYFPFVASLPYSRYDGMPYVAFIWHSLNSFFVVNTHG